MGSGLGNPRDQDGVNAQVSVSSGSGSGSGSSGGNSHVLSAHVADGTTALNTQSVSVGIAVHAPQPFSVNLTTPDDTRVKLISVKIQVTDKGQSVSDAAIIATDCDLAGGTTEFPLTKDQLDKILPHLQVGDTVQVDVTFAAPEGVALKIGIVGEGKRSKLEEIVEDVKHLAHRATS